MIADLRTSAGRGTLRVDAVPAAEIDSIDADGGDGGGDRLEPRVRREGVASAPSRNLLAGCYPVAITPGRS